MSRLARDSFLPALQRLDLLLYRQILRLRASYQLSLDEFRGLYVSDQQVDALILREASFGQVDVADLDVKAEALLRVAQPALLSDERWVRLCRCYALTAFEQDVLLLAFAPELGNKYPLLYAYLNNDVTRKSATLELALNLFATPATAQEHRGAFAAQRTLFGRSLLEFVGTAPEHSSLLAGFALAPQVREFLLGHAAFDTALAPFCQRERHTWNDWQAWPFAAPVRERFAEFAALLHAGKGPGLYVIEAPAQSGTAELCGNVLAQCGLSAWRIEARALNAERDNAALMRGLCQGALLDGAGLVLHETPLPSAEGNVPLRTVSAALLRQLRELRETVSAQVPCFVVAEPGVRWRELCGDTPYLHYPLPAPGLPEREGYWRWHLRRQGLSVDGSAIAAVADYFHLDWQQVQAAAAALALHGPCRVEQERLFAAAKAQSHGELGELASRVDKPYGLDDLVLPGAVFSRIKEIIAAIRARRLVFEEWGLRRRLGGGSGLVALFGGASGTGKTMTAGVIANAIGLDLYRVELAGVVSKYIGETEKNLDRIFNAARQSNCVLLLDEADALFGKRTEVSDAHDRYANIEVAYLLQKLESHDGIVILTTNLAKNIDAAFTRRLQFIIEFPRPDVSLRERLWRNLLGGGVPLGPDIDFSFLSRQFDNTGGDIRNMVLDAALMAAAGETQVVDMALLLRAAARQMMKQGKVPSAVEFKHYFSLVDNRGA
jgi:hypothetical protein